MAQRIVYRLEDDLDNSEAAETIVFGIDSVSYEIDLSESNAQKLRDLLAPYVASGRRVGGRRALYLPAARRLRLCEPQPHRGCDAGRHGACEG